MVTLPFFYSLWVALESKFNGYVLSNRGRIGLLIWAIIQIVVHIYFFILLRNHNQHFTVPDESEDQWTFGQIIVMFTLMAMVFEFYREIMAERMERRKECQHPSAEN
jgi:hypothetical protein